MTKQRPPQWLEAWAARYCAKRDLFRVFRRAATSPSDHERDTRAILLMRGVLSRARGGEGREADGEARKLWAYACGVGGGRRPTRTSQALDDEFLKVLDSSDPAAAINELIRDWQLEAFVPAINAEISATYTRKAPQLPLEAGRKLSEAFVLKILDGIMSFADPKRPRKDKVAARPGKRVEDRIQSLRKVARVRSRRKKASE